ncbi:AraC family transcriptional regulator [Phaeocystidibacter luteus]|uniref:AraC family transcriptional regulator n=2 Tax=Phaeocystidibacter luteus TaxID=911197 RepID=A0A6N6RFR8_9FLAO|nr:AraC family transcriptional regulator [Phaeocystidibacter luteus]
MILGSRRNYAAGKWLALLLLLCIFYISPHMFGYAGWYGDGSTRAFLFFVPFMQVFLIGPVVFFYTKALLNHQFKLQKSDRLHFIPAVLYGLYSLIVFVTDVFVMDDYYFYADGRDKDLADWYQVTGLLSMIAYLILSLRHYSVYKTRINEEVSYADSILFKWVRNFMLAFLCLLVLRILFFIFNPDWGQFGSQFWYYFAFSLVFTYVAIAGYSNVVQFITMSESGIRVYNVFHDEISPAADIETGAANASNIDQPTKIDSARNDLDTLKEQLSNEMKESKLYQNPRLTLTDVAESLNTTTKSVSEVVNQGFGMNFNDYVNAYRVEAVKAKLEAQEHLNHTLLGIAIDCGFNSKATFNRAFKKHCGISPMEFLNRTNKN